MAWFGRKEQEPPKAPPPGPGDGQVRLPALSATLSADERAFLVTCCDTGTIAVVTWPDQAVVRRTVFRHVDGDSLIMQIVEDSDPPYQYRHLTQCVVSFFYANRVATFVGYEESSGAIRAPGQLTLRMPTQIAVEGRTRFRIPILESLEMEATVLLEGRRLTVTRPVDINLAGMMLAFATAQDPGLRTDQVVTLTISVEGRACEVPVAVRHRKVSSTEVLYGCLFHNGANGWEFPHDRELNDLVVAVERFWARNRTR